MVSIVLWIGFAVFNRTPYLFYPSCATRYTLMSTCMRRHNGLREAIRYDMKWAAFILTIQCHRVGRERERGQATRLECTSSWTWNISICSSIRLSVCPNWLTEHAYENNTCSLLCHASLPITCICACSNDQNQRTSRTWEERPRISLLLTNKHIFTSPLLSMAILDEGLTTKHKNHKIA